MYLSPSTILFKKSTRNHLLYAFIQKLNCSVVKVKTETLNESHRKSLSQKIIASNIFEDTSNVSALVSSNYVSKKNRFIDYCFVADVSVAEKVADQIVKNLSERNSIIEGNAGFGLLTHFLLQSNVKQIKIIEARNKSNKLLKSIISKNADKISFTSGNIFSINLKSKELFKELIKDGLGLGKSVSLVGVVINYSFFKGLILEILNESYKTKLSSKFFLVVSKQIINNLHSFKNSQLKFGFYCLFNFFFSYQIIEEYPREAFLPLSDKNEKSVYLVKYVMKRKSPIATLDFDHFQCFMNYLKILEKRRYDFVIKTLERWFPDCGPHLIAMGLSCANQVCDLTYEDALNLFFALMKCESFSNFETLQPVFETGRLYLQLPEVENLTARKDVKKF